MLRKSQVLLMFGVLSGLALAQNPLSTDTKFWYDTIKKDVIRAAEKMPEENYSFKPAPTVRSFGQIVGHIADDQYYFCMTAKGEKSDKEFEKTLTAKAALVSALKESFAYCDAVYANFKDADATKPVQSFAGPKSLLSWLSFNYAHTYEHYGNIVTYMRIKGLVPPSSEK
jgi:uncharacterized damage-inducible protein DinB